MAAKIPCIHDRYSGEATDLPADHQEEQEMSAAAESALDEVSYYAGSDDPD